MFWSLPPEANDFWVRATGAGSGAHLPQQVALEETAVTHLEQAQQMVATTMVTEPSFVGVGGTGMTATAIPLSAYHDIVGAHAQAGAQTVQAAMTAHANTLATSVPYPMAIGNRVREVVLESTNAFGVNAMPIAETNHEYFNVMWPTNASAMMGYLAAGTGLISALSVPLSMGPLGADPAMMGAGIAAVAGQAGETGVQALGAPLTGAAEGGAGMAGGGAGVAGGASSAIGAAGQGGAGTSQGGALAPVGAMPGAAPQEEGQSGTDMLSSAQGLSGPLQSAPSMLSGLMSPLSSLTSLPSMIGGQLGGLMGPMMSAGSGLGGGIPPVGGEALGAPAAGAGALGGAGGGGFGGGMSAVLTKPSAGQAMPGPLGVPASWWGSAASQSADAEDAQLAGARSAGTPGAGMGPGMYGMGAAGAGRDRRGARDTAEADKTVFLDSSGDAVPVLTDDGVVYAHGQGV